MRFSSLRSWLWRNGSKQDQVEEGKDKGTQSKEREANEGTGMELAKMLGASSSATSSASLQEAIDWSIGWYEPHGPGFCSDDDSFAVLVPCYASPPPALPGAPPSLSKSQLWADVLSKVAMETKAETSKNSLQ